MEYPKSIIKGRKNIEGTVLGCLFQDLLLIKEYDIKDNNFISDEGKFYFGILNNLLRKNILEVTDTDIRLNSTDDVIEQYKTYGGMKTIEKLKRAADLRNFEAYIDELFKRNLYMELCDDGLDIEKEIEIETKSGIKRMKYLDVFEVMTCEEVVKFMQNRLCIKTQGTISNGIEESCGEIPEDFIEELYEGKTLGISFDSVEDIKLLPYISKETLGLKKKTLSMIASFVNVGKTTLLCNMILSLVSKDQKILVITNEMKIKDYWTNFLVYIGANILEHKGLTKRKVKSGNLTEDDKRALYKAREVYNERFADKLIICSILDSDMDLVDKLTRKYSLSKSIDVLVYDTFKQNFDKAGEVSYKDLIKDSRDAEKLCKKYDLIGLCAIQLSQVYLGNLVLDLSMLAGAKQINEILENLIMMRALYKTELDKDSRHYIHPFVRFKNERGEWDTKEIELDKNGTYRVLFLTKTRDGETFEDSNTAVLCSYAGRTGTFKEICLCHPVRGMINQNYTTKK